MYLAFGRWLGYCFWNKFEFTKAVAEKPIIDCCVAHRLVEHSRYITTVVGSSLVISKYIYLD